MKFGKIICHKNKRNCKNLELLKKYKLSVDDKKILNKRIKVENFFAHLKTFRRINVRYGVYRKSFAFSIHDYCIKK
jgi:transposase